MQITTKNSRVYWVTPAVGVACGLIYLIAFSLGGHPGYGLIALGVMVAFSAGIALVGRRSETVRGCSTTATSGWPGSTCGPRP